MSQQDDFEIVPEAPETPTPPARQWLWVLLIVALVVFAFAVGMAATTYFNRIADPTANDLTPTGQPAATNLAFVTATNTLAAITPSPVLPTPTQPPPAPPSPTGATTTVAIATVPQASPTTATVATPTTAPSPITKPGCQIPSYPLFTDLYDPASLGCPTSDASLVWSAWEAFERGAMLWRSDTDRAYGFFQDGAWAPLNERWDNQPIPSRGDPPQGLQTPIRGFGYVWAIRDDLFQRLGWATDQERGFCAVIQNYEHGFILQSSDIEFCREQLYNHARAPEWKPLLLVISDNGVWRNVASSGVLPTRQPTALATLTPNSTTLTTPTGVALVTAVATPTATTAAPAQRTRPQANGAFAATQGSHTLDADFGDWPGGWTPLTAVVQGNENYAGPQDLSGEFQVTWAGEGLYLAVRVVDERYRSGPSGTDLWQGDSFEIHLDRALQADFDSPLADSDDYQIGVNFGSELNEVRFYRWLPLEKESEFPGAGVAVATDNGYQAELLLPWSLFDLPPGDLRPSALFGFNLSINDNDAEFPAQETVISAAPKRTTYNNPTEWATLALE